jgi:hypothetical protein
MSVGAVVVNRNDGYKDFERGIIHFRSMLDTFDEVFYIDWNSPSGSFFWEIKDQLPQTGKLKHIMIPPHIASILTHNDPTAQQCNEAVSRNLGIRRLSTDFIVSTNLDIIPPKRKELDRLVNSMGTESFVTVSRREAPKELVYKYGKDGWRELRDELCNTIPERRFPAQVTPNDRYSLINCCGDFQIAHAKVWHWIRGFEESMLYQCFCDTNVQKKAAINDFKLAVAYEPALFHMEHGAYFTKADGTRVADPENKGAFKGETKAYNDPWRYVEFFNETDNDEDWGLGATEIEYETY